MTLRRERMVRMNRTEKILEQARTIFDVAGATEYFLILGLESTKRRNLDDFYVNEDGEFGFPGFASHFNPRVETIIGQLIKCGIETAQIITTPDIRLKTMAVKAGIGKWGKNSLVIHPKYGPWLRFILLRISRRLTPEIPIRCAIFKKCHKCNKCLEACPVSALKPFYIPDRKICIAWQQLGEVTTDVLQRCDLCLQACIPQRP